MYKDCVQLQETKILLYWIKQIGICFSHKKKSRSGEGGGILSRPGIIISSVVRDTGFCCFSVPLFLVCWVLFLYLLLNGHRVAAVFLAFSSTFQLGRKLKRQKLASRDCPPILIRKVKPFPDIPITRVVDVLLVNLITWSFLG